MAADEYQNPALAGYYPDPSIVRVGDGMVVQRDQPIPVWGWAAAGSEVQIHFNGQNFSARADSDGEWRVEMPGLPGGKTFSVQDSRYALTLRDNF